MRTRRATAHLAHLALALTATAFGCGSEAEDSPEDQYAGDYARAACANLGTCCAENGLDFDRDECVLGAAGFVAAGTRQAKAAGAQFDEQAAAACIARVRELTASCTPTRDDDRARAACAAVWNGVKAPGAPCDADLECRSDARGRARCMPLAAGGRRCTIMTEPATLGDRCAQGEGTPSDTLADCSASGLQCSLAGTCVELAAHGEGCPGFVACEQGAHCDGATATCAPNLAPGDTCSDDRQCDAGACIRGACGQNAVGTVAPCTGEPA